MIEDLNATLESFISGEAPAGSMLSTARIEFAPPDRDFRNGLSKLTLDLYLHEIRENLEMRRSDRYVVRDDSGERAARRHSPALVDCAYVITAWSARAPTHDPTREEHRLLSQALRLLLSHRRIAPRHWQGSVAGQSSPYPTLVAQPDAIRNPAEFWTALGHYPKPSLTYVVTIAMSLDDDTAMTRVVGPTDDAVRVDVDQPPAPEI